MTNVVTKGQKFKILPDYRQSCSSSVCEYLMNLIIDITLFQFFLSANLSLPYKRKLIRLLSLLIEKEIGIFPKSFIKSSLVYILEIVAQEIMCCSFSFKTTVTKLV